MNREDILRSREYWITKMQIELYNEIEDYMKANNLNRTNLSQQLNVSKSYISQLLNGDFDNKFSKLVDLALFMGKAPIINFPRITNILEQERSGVMFPYKFFDYYSMQNPAEKVVDKQIKFNWANFTKKDQYHLSKTLNSTETYFLEDFYAA